MGVPYEYRPSDTAVEKVKPPCCFSTSFTCCLKQRVLKVPLRFALIVHHVIPSSASLALQLEVMNLAQMFVPPVDWVCAFNALQINLLLLMISVLSVRVDTPLLTTGVLRATILSMVLLIVLSALSAISIIHSYCAPAVAMAMSFTRTSVPHAAILPMLTVHSAPHPLTAPTLPSNALSVKKATNFRNTVTTTPARNRLLWSKSWE